MAFLWIFPIILKPDYGTALVYLSIVFLLYWTMAGRIDFLIYAAIIIFILMIIIVMKEPYVLERIKGFWDPEKNEMKSGWHILQYQKTLARGGFTGLSWGKGIWSQVYLPNAYSDSIFATLGEAIGFIGLMPILAVIIAWLFWGILKARKLMDLRKCAIAYGLILILVIQSILHISVTVGLFPPTGITLPMFSYGGSSLSATMLCIGITLSMLKSGEC